MVVTTKKAYKFGIEIECTLYRESFDDGLKPLLRKLPIRIGSDPSVNSNSESYMGTELKTSNPLGFNEMFRVVSKLTKALDRYNAKVNRTCGFHVHVSNKRFHLPKYMRRIAHTWVAVEDVFMATQPDSRQNNSYSVRLLRQQIKGNLEDLPATKDRMIEKMTSRGVARDSRYYSLNFAALNRHGTIECRLHAGTLNANKIKHWMILLRAFFNYCLERYKVEEVKTLFKTSISDQKIERVFNLLELPDKTKQFYQEKIYKHLFSILADQQRSANKLDELRPMKKRVVKAYEKAGADLHNVRTQESQFMRVF